MRRLDRYLAVSYAAAVALTLAVLCAVYLLVDFADHARLFHGEGWPSAALELYAAKLAVIVAQLVPAALILGAGIALTRLRGQGELTAASALGCSPGRLVAPALAVAMLAGAGLSVFSDRVVPRAEHRVQQIAIERFHLWGDWGRFHGQHWFRMGDRFIRLGAAQDGGWRDVTVLEMETTGGVFHLRQRIDAASLVRNGDGWSLIGATVRTFDAANTIVESHAQRLDAGPFDPAGLVVDESRPSELSNAELDQHAAARQASALPSGEFILLRMQRNAAAFLGVPGTAISAAATLRRRRRGGLTTALLEGAALTALLWALTVVSRALALGGHLPPWLGAWGVDLFAAGGGAWALARARMTK